MALKNGDFVKLNYTGFLVDGGACFDTTIEEVAKKNNIHSAKYKYGPVTICIGNGHILPGIDDALEGKNANEKFELILEPQQAFGLKSADAVKTVKASEFRDSKINASVGDQIMYNDKLAIVKFISNRIVMLDFNHPYAGETVKYEIEILGMEEDKKEQLDAVVSNELRFDPNKYSIDLKKENNDEILVFNIDDKGLPEEFQKEFKEHVLKYIKVKDLVYEFKK